jgi:hypothetical protein
MAGEAGEMFDDIWHPVFSPGGRPVAFGARKGRDGWWKTMVVGE